MTVFTIYNHGTDFNRVTSREKGEVIGHLSDLTTGIEATTTTHGVTRGAYMINEGPGSTGGGLAHPSKLNPFTGTEKGTVTGSGFKKQFYGDTSKHWAATGLIAGAGWSDNMWRAAHIVQSLKFDHGVNIDTVNLCGWSRGGVTCIRIANVFKELFDQEITVNIFAYDPVAGQDAGFDTINRTLPNNVANFVAVLSMHEMRKTFKPQDISRVIVQDPTRTQVSFLPFPGTHGDQVMESTNYPEPAQVARSLGFAMLKHWGTRFDTLPSEPLITNVGMLEAYSAMSMELAKGKRSLYKRHQTSGIGKRLMGMGLRRRGFNTEKEMDKYVAGGKGGYFINEHHRACMMYGVPWLYRVIFHAGGGRTLSKLPHAAATLMPKTMQAMMLRGWVVKEHGSYFAKRSSGFHGRLTLRTQWYPRYPLHP